MTTDTFNRESLAKWYAKQHLNTDPGITKVIYLPDGAGPREIRFLEINTLIREDRSNRQLVPIDFGVDMGQESEHKLYVVDLTKNQWARILAGSLALPKGWSLESKQEFFK
jgi:hypothetical protein